MRAGNANPVYLRVLSRLFNPCLRLRSWTIACMAGPRENRRWHLLINLPVEIEA